MSGDARKTGRPSENRVCRLPDVRLTPDELIELERRAHAMGMQKAEYIRYKLFTVDDEEPDERAEDWSFD